jgi:hypothetical protein
MLPPLFYRCQALSRYDPVTLDADRAATAGILFPHEPITLRYVLASVAVLGGIFLVVIEKRRIARFEAN